MSEKLKQSLQLICPVYNEEEIIEEFYCRLIGQLDAIQTRYDYRILFVADKCVDNTTQILDAIIERDNRVQLLVLSNRFGHQMSLLAGIDHADSDVVIMMDSDLQHPPEIILELLAKYEEGYDVVSTIRKVPKDSSMLKRWSSKLFYRILNKISEIDLSPGEADFRLASRRVIEVFQTKIRERNQFLRGLFRWIGFSHTVVHFEPDDRAKGVSKYNWSIMFKFATHGLVSFSQKPLQLSIIVGLIFSLVGILIAIWSLGSYFVYSEIPSGWTSLSVMIAFFSGVQLMFLGIIGQYIGAIFDETKSRPHYIIDRKNNL